MVLALLLATRPSQAQQTLFSDNFDSIPPNQRQLDGNTWLVFGTSDAAYFYPDNGTLNTGNLDNFAPIYAFAIVSRPEASEWSDIKISTDIVVLQKEGTVSLTVRYRPNNYYVASLHSLRTRDGAPYRQLEIWRLENGVPYDIAKKGDESNPNVIPVFDDGKPHRFEFAAIGQELTVYLDGRPILSVNDARFKSGSAGIGGRTTQAIFDNVVVTGPAGVAAAPVDGTYRIMVYSGLQQRDAEQERAGLTEYDAEVLPWEGRYALFIGKFSTQNSALEERTRLEEMEGLTLEGIRFVPNDLSRSGALPPGRYRVLAGEFATMSQAQARKSELETRGIYPTEIVSKDNRHRVLAGYPSVTRDEAEDVQANIERKGVTGLSVIEIETADRQPPATGIASAPTPKPTPDTSSFRSRYIDALTALDYEGADAILDEWAKVDPLSQEIVNRREEVRRLITMRDRQRELERQVNQQVATLMANARSAYSAGRLTEAANIWREVQSQAVDEQTRQEAAQQIAKINNELLSSPQTQTQAAPESNNLLIGAIILAVFAALGLGIYFIARKRTSAAPPPPPMAATPVPQAPVLNPGLAGATAAKTAKGPAKGQQPAPPIVPPPAAPVKTVTDSERIRPGSFLPAGEIPGHDHMAPPIATPTGNAAPPATARPGAAPPPPPSSKDFSSDETVHLDLAFGDAPAAQMPPPATHEAPQEIPSTDHQRITPVSAQRIPSSEHVAIEMSSGEFATPPMPDSAPALFAGPPSSPAVQLDQGVFYAQNFEDEEVGKPPRNWKGSYDYANLLVAPRSDGNGSSKCMRFEKKSGSGSAYYSCRFPDASGRVVVEFDLRCDDKNKYLLGFYIEKDEDFRHSIHTVVHRDTSRSDRVALRLQNESTPYKLGEWCHIKFLIDLPRNLVDGYVDDKPVAVGVRLMSRPKVVNTLSIRDNLATEGILMVDNIRISRER